VEKAGELVGVAYGEDLEDVSQRSLGYRLLAPLERSAWRDEVEALARRLQAAPYSEHWPATDLFCSALLADGRRLVALARYGLTDHTPSQRRGGLELIGLVGPGGLDVPTALAVYRWLGQRRAEVEDLHRLGGSYRLADVLAADAAHGPAVSGVGSGPSQPEGWPVPVLPVRLWQDGAFLFAAGSPSDPDHHLGLLQLAAAPTWQWLPLVGPDFPLSTYAQRGPLVAWTPHVAGVALKLDRKEAEGRAPAPARRGRARPLTWLVVLLLLALVGLLAGNLWFLHDVRAHLAATPPGAGPAPEPAPKRSVLPRLTRVPEDASREAFVAGLYRLLKQNGEREWLEQPALLERYEELAARHPELRVRPGNTKGKVAVAAVSVLAGRSADRIEASVRKALENKGFGDKVIDAACAYVREQFAAELKERP
jgi:hypothetical protein